MAARPVSKALRSSFAKHLSTPTVQRRTLVTALNAAAKPVAAAVPKAAVTGNVRQTRGMKTINFAGTKEVVYGMLVDILLRVALHL